MKMVYTTVNLLKQFMTFNNLFVMDISFTLSIKLDQLIKIYEKQKLRIGCIFDLLSDFAIFD